MLYFFFNPLSEKNNCQIYIHIFCVSNNHQNNLFDHKEFYLSIVSELERSKTIENEENQNQTNLTFKIFDVDYTKAAFLPGFYEVVVSFNC